jgi:hypothetical protein
LFNWFDRVGLGRTGFDGKAESRKQKVEIRTPSDGIGRSARFAAGSGGRDVNDMSWGGETAGAKEFFFDLGVIWRN